LDGLKTKWIDNLANRVLGNSGRTRVGAHPPSRCPWSTCGEGAGASLPQHVASDGACDGACVVRTIRLSFRKLRWAEPAQRRAEPFGAADRKQGGRLRVVNIASVCTHTECMIEQNLAGIQEGRHSMEKAPFAQDIARPRPRAKRNRGGGGGGRDVRAEGYPHPRPCVRI
jgi:hypothetical protein